MDLRQKLVDDRSKAHIVSLAEWVVKDPSRVKTLLELYLDDEDLVSQRAAWVMAHCSDTHPELFEPYVSDLFDQIRSQRHPGIRRNATRVLAKMNLPEKYWGQAVDICMDRIADVQEPVAIRRFSMEVVWNICQHIPEIGEELRLILEDGMEYGSPGFKSYGNKLLKKLNKG